MTEEVTETVDGRTPPDNETDEIVLYEKVYPWCEEEVWKQQEEETQ